MTLIDWLSKLLLAPPAKGGRAILYGLLLMVLPTAIRYGLAAYVQNFPFFTYMPFVIAAAVLLDKKYAIATALLSWLIADMLFMEPRFQVAISASEIIGFFVFIISAGFVIALVESARTIVENSLRPARPDGFSAAVVFSSEGGQAWASWYGSHSWVRLGPEEEVAEMMEDFLAQRELGKRLGGQDAAQQRL